MRPALLLLALTLGQPAFAQDARIAGAPPDNRQFIVLDDTERNFILHEMRDLLAAAQAILEATVADDRQRVIESARAAGVGPQGPAQHIPPGLRAKLPEAFRKLGLGTHQAFDDIASGAEAGVSRDALLKQLAATMQRCVACHAAYGLRSPR
jgi:hypothetical protein